MVAGHEVLINPGVLANLTLQRSHGSHTEKIVNPLRTVSKECEVRVGAAGRDVVILLPGFPPRHLGLVEP